MNELYKSIDELRFKVTVFMFLFIVCAILLSISGCVNNGLHSRIDELKKQNDTLKTTILVKDALFYKFSKECYEELKNSRRR